MLNYFKKKKVSKLIKDYSKLLLFIGSGRTGSTLIGQLINYHPQCLIGNEYNIIRKVIDESKSFDKEILNMATSAYVNFEKGFSNKDLNKYQKKWSDLTTLSKDLDFEKDSVNLVGDKIGGRLNNVFKQHPNEFKNLLNSFNKLYLLHIIRNPINTAKSFLKSHSHEVKTFEEAFDRVLINHHLAYEITNIIDANVLTIYYEDLQREPKKNLEIIFKWLDLEVNDNWMNKIVKYINSSETIISITEDEEEIVKRLLKKYDLKEIEEKYSL